MFLWGALVQALVLELKDGNISLIKGLAERITDNRLLRSALVEALVGFGEGSKEEAKECIVELIGPLNPPKNFFVELSRLLHPMQDDLLQAQPQKMIVVEAAMRLRLIDLLENLAVEPSPWLRNIAAQNIFYLWKQDHQAGMRVLDSLSYRVRGKYGLPDLGAAESMLALIGAILGFEHKDPVTLEALLTIGRRSLRRLLYLADLDKAPTTLIRIRKAFMSIIYNLVTSAILRFVLSIISTWGEHTYQARLEHFFKLSPEQKKLIGTFIPFIDYEEPGFEKRVAEMTTVLGWGDLVAGEIVGYAILGRGAQKFDETLEIARQLVEYGLSFTPPRFWTGGPLWNLWQGAAYLENPNSDKFMLLMERITTAIQNDPALWLEHVRRDRVPLGYESRASNIQNHIGAYYIFTKRAEIPEVIQTYLERAMRTNDSEYIEAYIRELTGIFEMGYYQIAIAGLKPIGNYKHDNIQKALIDFLARARNYDSEYVEDLLLRGEFTQEIADHVLANPTSERLTDLLSYQLVTIIYDLFILGPKLLRNELKWLFSKSLELPGFQDAVVLLIHEIFNLILGEVIFSVPPDAPSRQMLKEVKNLMIAKETDAMYQADSKHESLLDFYSDVATQLNTKVFLWGALVQALVLELNDGNLSILKGLAEQTTDNRLLRSALVEALVRFGEGNKEKARELLLS